MRKKIIFYFFLIAISLLVLELLLRTTGFKPWVSEGNNQETTFKFNPQLGWISKEGEYLIPSLNNSEKIKFTIEEDGNRYSGKTIKKNQKEIILIGGSFTQGAGVSDNETFAYQLQSILINHKVWNYGQAGFGSIQSLLLLNQILKKKSQPRIIIYGFIDHHLRRNVARGQWLETLQKSTNTGFSQKPAIPYAIIDENNDLKIMPKISYLTLPLRDKSALITIIEKIYMKQTTKQRKKIQFEVLSKSIKKMDELAKKNNSKLIVVNLGLDKKKSDNFLVQISKENKFNYVDCRTPNFEAYALKNEYHPNDKGHKFFSECINEYLNKKLFL